MIIFKIYKLRVVLHACWIVFALFMIFSFILSGVFLAVSIVGFDLCEILDGIFNDVNEFTAYPDLISGDVADKIKICKAELGGNGSILSEFGIEDTLS